MFELKNICVTFGSVEVLRDINLRLNAGDRIGLCGLNGSGKSTVINVATGFARPVSGSITMEGKSLTGATPWEFARAGIARTFQRPRILKSCTLAKQLGQNRTAIERAKEILGTSHTAPPLDVFADEVPLSSLRIFEVARALALSPKILFLDEPSAGLAKPEIEDLVALIRQYLDPSSTLVVVEHRQDFMSQLSGRVLTLDAGTLIDGQPARLADA